MGVDLYSLFRCRSRIAIFVTSFVAVAAFSFQSIATAGTTFRFDRAQATAGETVSLVAVYYNDTQEVADWTPAERLVLQWRSSAGATVRTLAHLAGDAVPVSVPVNNFVQMQWKA